MSTKTKGRIPKDLITKEEAGPLIKRTPMAVYRLVQKRQIPFYKPHGRILFDREELLEWVAQFHNPAEPNS